METRGGGPALGRGQGGGQATAGVEAQGAGQAGGPATYSGLAQHEASTDVGPGAPILPRRPGSVLGRHGPGQQGYTQGDA